MTTNIIRAIETASKECYENDNPMSVYFDKTQGTWLTAYAEDFGTIDGKVNFEVVSSGVRYPFDERLISQINSVDDEAIAALQEAGEIEKTIEINTSSLQNVIKDILTGDIRPMGPVIRYSTETGIFNLESAYFDANADELTFDVGIFYEFISDIDIDGLIKKYIEEQKNNFVKMIESQIEIEAELKAEEEERNFYDD